MTQIKIEVRSTKIPFLIGNVELFHDYSDESREKVAESLEKIIDVVSNKDRTEETLKLIVKEFYDSTFGEGSYDKLYEQTPSNIELGYLVQTVAENIMAYIAKKDVKEVSAKFAEELEL